MGLITMPEKILVTGSAGQLGSSLRQLAGNFPQFEFTFVDREEMDLGDNGQIEQFFAQHHFDYVINCAAHTAVDKAESELELAEQLNHHAVRAIAQAAKAHGAFLVHISTDYVFDGCHYKPYQEDHPTTAPVNHYGLTKLHGERAVRESGVDSYIIRTSWVYSEYGNNFVKTMLRLGAERDVLTVINDQIGTPTYAADLAAMILSLIAQREEQNDPASGCTVFHYSNEGACSWYDFAVEIFAIEGLACSVKPIGTKDYPTPAKRPHYSLLSKQKIREYSGLEVPHWKTSLKTCLKNLKEL